MSNTFFCIGEPSQTAIIRLLQEACSKRNISFVLLDPDRDLMKSVDNTEGQLLYRCNLSESAKILEKKLLLRAPMATLYETAMHGISKMDHVMIATMIHEQEGIPMPKTCYGLPTADDMEYVADTLGLPLVIKAAGGSHGVGVMKVESLSSLRSVADYLRSLQDPAHFLLRAFIDVRASARLVVLGDRVIDSIEYQAPSTDFRTNLGDNPTVVAKTYPQEVNDIAVRAVNVLGWEFGGVDILLDGQGNSYVAEVNNPCYFPRCQECTGTDIAGMMVDYLLEKQKVLRA